jgi:hypothetical protein
LCPPQADINNEDEDNDNHNNTDKNFLTSAHARWPQRKLLMHPLIASQSYAMGEPLNGMENL